MSKQAVKKAEAATATERLFTEFREPSYDEWKAEAEKALKGASFESRLVTKTYEEIDLQPIYRPEDVAESKLHLSLPGGEPYLRGTRAGGYLTRPWLIAQECDQASADECNRALHNDLARGLQSVHLRLDTATRLGFDPDVATDGEVGDEGLSLACLQDLALALDGIDIRQYPVMVHAGISPVPVLALFGALARAQGAKPRDLSGCIAADPLGMMALLGKLPGSLASLYDDMASASAWAAFYMPHMRTIMADGCPYANAGANAVQELAFTLATAVEYVRAMRERGLKFADITRRMQFSLSLGANMFMELAKIRAARLLWHQAAKAFGGKGQDCMSTIHGRTSCYTKTVYDPYVNILRTTTEAFAGAVAGLDSLSVGGFDEAVRQGDEFSRRISRNTQIVLQQECTLLQPVDPAGGAWYVEALTFELARKAWDLFRKTEENGGMFKALQAGFPQAQADKTAQKRAANLAKRRDVIVGTNMYANLAEKPLTVPEKQTEEFKALRRREVDEYRRETDDVERWTRLGQIAKQRTTGGSACVASMDAAVAAAMAGCTAGEISAVLRREDLAPLAVTKLRIHRAAELYEEVRRTTERHGEATGDNVRVFLANMGPIPQHKPRADFSRGFFEVGGFAVLTNNGFASVEDAAAAAAESGADVVVICSTDATYPELVPPLARLLKEKTPGICLVLAGLPPEDLQAVYKEAGVDEFIHVRADCHAVLSRLQQRKGMK
ncbi:MAG TPA: methylmalonyl-CoA mutase family protein [Negativicutes bacterium]|nr:methylmalonyl-CoA mutase family protein [Negativicutes bacterium]